MPHTMLNERTAGLNLAPGFDFGIPKPKRRARPRRTFAQGKIDNARWVNEVIRGTLGDRLTADCAIRHGDDYYYQPTVGELRELLETTGVNRLNWVGQRFECNDFAFVLKGAMSLRAYETEAIRYGFCFGIAWGRFTWVDGDHAVNWFIDADDVLRFVEPRNNTIHDADACLGDLRLMVV